MEKIFIFFLIFISSRHLQVSLNWGPKLSITRGRISIQENKKTLNSPLKLNSEISIYKSIYSLKKTNPKNSNKFSLIFTTSKKKRPPLKKDGLQIFIPIHKWGKFYFIR